MDTNEIFREPEKQSGLQGLQKNFAERQQKLFDQLNNIEKSVNKNVIEDSSNILEELSEDISNGNKSLTKHFQGRESIFKRPEVPLSKRLPRHLGPNFKRNPKKWIKYSLSDVKNEDMSEQCNTATAMSFLQDLEKRKSNQDDPMDVDADRKVIFKRKFKMKYDSPSKQCCSIEVIDDKPSFKGTKVVMPEYIVGQKKQSKNVKKLQKTNEKKKELTLDHLLEEDDGD